MVSFHKCARAQIRRFVSDERGSFAVSWGMSLLAIIFAVGAAYDTSQASKAKHLAQIAADSMALTASVAVDRGNPDKFIEGHSYNYSEIGGPSHDFTGSMSGVVEYDVIDGDDKLIARATITGAYSTAFMSMIGVRKINLKAVSDVAYAAKEGYPASVFFVADNSGSMGDYDSTGVKKLTSLSNGMMAFMDILDTLDYDGVDDTFRTALYPYSADPYGEYSYIDSDGVIPAKVVNPIWGTLNDGNITQMTEYAGTDSSGALQDAADAFDLEIAEHIAINGEANPLKFLVFMTDGSNNQTNECRPVLEDEDYWVDTYYYSEPVYVTELSWFDEYVIAYEAGTGDWEDREVCGWDYHFDRRSLAACDQMKASGVKIYAIAYDVAADEKVHAEDFMQACSSGEEYFKSANDSTALDAAFDAIGDSILTEVIRIKR